MKVFPDDDYGWHYLGWNLDRAGIESQEAERGFREAVHLSQPNRWWNSRLVTFLISQARFSEAETEWEHALERVDPDQVFVYEDAGFAMDFHAWVIREWLEQGELTRARKVFDQIPRSMVSESRLLHELEWQLLDAEEAERLGHAVYAPGIPMEERWKKPEIIPDIGPSGARLTAWYPGRVIRADSTMVEVALATTNDLSSIRVIRTTFDKAEWMAANAASPPETASGYLFFARYGNDTPRVVPFVARPAPWEEARRRSDPLRYLRMWADR